MDYLSTFNIPFLHLPAGSHKFQYDINNKFFESFENAVVQKGKAHIDLDFNRQENILILNFEITGAIDVECDRCLGRFDFPVHEKHELIIKLVADVANAEEDAEIISISDQEHTVNVAQHIYDYMSLDLPYRKVHPDNENGESTCDPEFLKQIDQLSQHEENHNDPRWDALKKIKSKK